ncbi:hypothetical protein HYPSUDRAFT_36170 [Hypholoma sublateritium FD-334 SS-4]|uniref:G-protein coupled receptors family 1 profile domain-containing protein n=1 Tax=Hypholoma sublateritium (strain FD-334 SS-4) TaxID=945553 RepID=A0A0D2LFP3_HYPSF|nr:hypothetical protein HYPSUDRAFT_36170 [Hypholoma sublateritium FD-334 SS-4]
MSTSNLSQYTTQEPAALLWLERANYIAVNVGLIGYGIHIISLFACLYYLAKERNTKKNAKWAIFVLILFACGSINISVNMKSNEMTWIDYRGFPGGPLMFLLQEQAITINTVRSSFSTIVGFLTDLLLIYRVHVVYRMWYVIVIPILMWLAMSILGALFVLQAAQPQSSIWAHTTLNFSLPYFAILMGLNILLTGLLVTRLLYMRYKITKALGSRHGRTYTSVVSMLLESAVPYGIISIIFLVLYTLRSTAALLFIPLLTQIQVQCMSTTLIIMRVARGRAWTNETISPSKMSEIKFGPPPQNSSGNGSNTASDNSSPEIALGTFKANSNLELQSKDLVSMGSVGVV